LKRQGVPKRLRPPQPPRQPAYPSKAELALKLLAQFRQSHPMVKVKAVLADALYGTAPFLPSFRTPPSITMLLFAWRA